ncbi:Leptin receptor gene-related protein, partial [Schistosoma japonicum]
MTGVKTVIFVSLAASISFTFLLLACALPQYNVWWPLFMLIFYIIAPVPLLLAKNCQNSSSSEDLSVFLTTVIVTSAYALPILQWSTSMQLYDLDVVNNSTGFSISHIATNADKDRQC